MIHYPDVDITLYPAANFNNGKNIAQSILFEFDPLHISALNFITLYQGIKTKNIEERVGNFYRDSITYMLNYIDDGGELDETPPWQYSFDSDWTLPFLIKFKDGFEAPSNEVKEILNSNGIYKTVNLCLDNYIQMFLSHLTGEIEFNEFYSLDYARNLAQSNSLDHLLLLLNSVRDLDYSEGILSFEVFGEDKKNNTDLIMTSLN